ncbi:phospholipid-transporting ATPase ABCA3 isoform X3 [Drosophila virilis]|uniref:phospholipid-transporting ATPase ABCA3 isoform X3 n=1 Tax=Drosophila virilis TaxID=7244 RepID=UPI0013963DBB|nr:ATP-binding cassette sub-family A member 3 isoform X3 [Drosophila virilis]
MGKVTTCDKFLLLLWKNWVIQLNHKTQFVFELLLPVLFILLVALVRVVVDVENIEEKHYEEQKIDSLQLFNESIKKLSQSRPPNLRLVFSPVNDELESIMQDAAASLGMTVSGVDNAQELEGQVVANNSFAGVLFNVSMDNFEYTLRFPSELRTAKAAIWNTWLTKRLFLSSYISGPRNYNDDDGGTPPGYLREGFLPIQNAISMSYIRSKAKVKNDLPEIVLQRYPYPAGLIDPFINAISTMFSFLLLLSFIYPCTCITKYVANEKELQLKEVMKIMGLQNWLHWAAWFVKFFIMFTISILLMIIFMKIRYTDDVAVFTHADISVLIVFFLAYITATICFCFMMASFFSKSSTAAAVTGLIWFITYVPYMFTSETYDLLTLSEKLGLCVILNTAMAFGVAIIMRFEGTGEGLQWNNLFKPVNVDDNLTVGYVIIMLLISAVLYMLICLYVEQIFPGDYGVKRKWYFPCTRVFWCGKNKYQSVDYIDNEPEQNTSVGFEPEPQNKRVGLEIKNLKKVFDGKLVVKGISAKMFEDEITVLLGHNGAGKTTTISMLTGMLPPTSGTAIINGSDICTNIKGARMSLGVCPQHNVLFGDMSVANHLRFFSRLKGAKGKAIKKEVDKYLKMIQLENKANTAADKLSGGMKRKLSLCCALCGDTKVVLCDEPSSGMDPSARRQLWDLLRHEKAGRTILLTTHFMDEADVLGDRIAIMCDGMIKCNGSSFFLKKQFGPGYSLVCVKKANCQPAEVTAMLSKYIPGIRPKSDIGTELAYNLPDNYSYKFEQLFKELESRTAELNLNGFGVGNTSLEEVFMKMGADVTVDRNEEELADRLKGGAVTNNVDNESMKSDAALSNNTQLLRGMKLVSNQWHAMIYKKAIYSYRKLFLLILQNFVAVFFVVLTIMIARSRGTSRDLPAIKIGLAQYPVAVTVMERGQDLNANSLNNRIANKYEEMAQSFGPDYTYESTGDKSFTKYILDLSASLQVWINARYLAAATFRNDKIIAWLNNQPLHTAPLTMNMVHNAIAREVIGENSKISVTNWPLPYKTETLLQQLQMGSSLGTQLASNIAFCMCFITAFYALFVINERQSRAKLLQFVCGVKGWIFWFSLFLWDFITLLFTVLVIIVTLACFQEIHFSTFDELGRIAFVLIIFTFCVLPFTYAFSLYFKDASTGYARISIFNNLFGIAVFLTFVLLANFYDDSILYKILNRIFNLYPHFSLAMCINKISVNAASRSACSKLSGLPPILICEMVPNCCSIPGYFAWEYPGVLIEILTMVCVGIIIFLLLVLGSYGIHLNFEFLKRKRHPDPRTDMDDDVLKEKLRVENMSPEEKAAKNLVLDNLVKYYGPFLAVNQVSLCVEESECFGLLGVNGAGKTTTFKMMTGDETISLGAAYVQGLNLKTDMTKVYDKIGYCPQFDALLDNLTGRENLKIFCLLRGVRPANIKSISEDLGKTFGFTKHMNKKTKNYSGGNKRKLSAAIAVIGSPAIIYMDEPTTGMDPAARRHLWNIVCRLRDGGKSIVLTSHSMEECEALCTRLAVMVNGELKCIGSTQHLKNKFSKGRVLKLKVRRSGAPRSQQQQPYKESMLKAPVSDEDLRTPLPYESSSAATPVAYDGRSRTSLGRNDNNFRNGEISMEQLPGTPIPYSGSIADILEASRSVDYLSNTPNRQIEEDVVLSPDQIQNDIDKVKKFVSTNFPNAVLQEEYQGMLTYYIPLQGIKWSEIFGVIERNRNDLNLDDYSITQTTLEEIFLEFAQLQIEDKRNVKSRRKCCGC